VDALDKSIALTAERHKRRRAWLAKSGGESATDEGRALLEYLLPTLSDYMRSPDRPRPPHGLADVIGRIDPDVLGLVALSSLMNFIASRPKRPGDKSGPKRPDIKVRIAMGEALHRACYLADVLLTDRKRHRRLMNAATKAKALKQSDYRGEKWSEEQTYFAGHWLLGCVLALEDEFFGPVFGLDRNDVPFIHEWFEKDFAPALCADLELRCPVFHPSTERLHDWTGWRTGGYWNESSPISATFVRDYNPDTEKAVRRAFRDGSMKEHVDGVNALQRVGWTINRKMLPVVKQFAGEKRSTIHIPGKMRRNVREKKREELRRQIGKVGLPPNGGGVGKNVSPVLVAKDVATAEQLLGKTFYLPHSCDFRGRVYPIPHFNFSREDHVRSLFLFADGMPINANDGVFSGFKNIELLMIHVANCADSKDAKGRRISKRPFGERVEWARSNRDLIERIARDPIATVKEWKDADAPFSFVAGCLELAEAWDNPKYETRLPVCFDATCSGVQHLAMMMADEDAGKKVNLVAGLDEPQDVYAEIRKRVIERIEAERDDWSPGYTKRGKPRKPRAAHATFWLEAGLLDEGTGRKLVKRPAMTFCYAATESGMTDQVLDAWDDLLSKHNQKLDWQDAYYLACHVRDAAKEILIKPAEAMEFIQKLARIRAKNNLPFTVKMPTGFPWNNTYCESRTKRFSLPLDGVSARKKISLAVDWEPKIEVGKSKNAAAPNFVHGMDACHLIRVVNAALRENIVNIAVVHDSFGCLAPQAAELRKIIGKELTLLYLTSNVLGLLHDAAKQDLGPAELAKFPNDPETGKLDLMAVQHCEHSFL
jgi:Autographiviridae RNA polymerase